MSQLKPYPEDYYLDEYAPFGVKEELPMPGKCYSIDFSSKLLPQVRFYISRSLVGKQLPGGRKLGHRNG